MLKQFVAFSIPFSLQEATTNLTILRNKLVRFIQFTEFVLIVEAFG